MLSDHIQQHIFWTLQTGGCLLLHESSADSSCMSFLHYFHSAISNHLSIAISMSPEWMVAGLSVPLNFKSLGSQSVAEQAG